MFHLVPRPTAGQRRATGVLVVGALALSGIAAGPAAAQPAKERPTVGFVLDAEVLDGGEQITSVTLDTSRLGRIDPASLSTDTFTVHATATSPSPELDPAQLYYLYDQDRTVTKVSVDRTGDIVLELAHGEGVAGAATLAYSVQTGRNVAVDLTYSITQNTPLRFAKNRALTIGSFRQGATVDPEVDKFASGVTTEGIKYRLFTPAGAKAHRALVVWLHGNGEGGMPGHYNNSSQLQANRGALGLTTDEAQSIFDGAYVLAPQVPDTWYNIDTAGYDTAIKSLIDRVVATHRIDRTRIYVMGASAGGFMTVQMASRYPTFFAADVATCPALYLNRTGQYTTTEEQILKLNSTPTWFVQAKNDTTIPFDKASLWAYNLLDDALLTAYDNVVWDGYEFNGHFAWVYTARNDPTNAAGQTLWEWMAQQVRVTGTSH